MYAFFDIVNKIIDFMKKDMEIDGFVFSFWDVVIYTAVFGTACWCLGKIITKDLDD